VRVGCGCRIFGRGGLTSAYALSAGISKSVPATHKRVYQRGLIVRGVSMKPLVNVTAELRAPTRLSASCVDGSSIFVGEFVALSGELRQLLARADCQLFISVASHILQRPLPRSTTGRGMSGYRR
jgi:hypothetical protein